MYRKVIEGREDEYCRLRREVKELVSLLLE